MNGTDILTNAQALAREVRDRDLARQYDAERALPRDLFERVRDAGVLRMCMPAAWGGPELTSMEQVEVVEALSRADASLGWCAFIWADSGLYSGYLDDAIAREMYPRLDMATSGWVYPVGMAVRADDGFRMTGRWMFGSGCDHCDWLAAGCLTTDRDGVVGWRILLAPRDAYEIEDTWYTTGLHGTGSKHYSCTDLFVPEEHSFDLLGPAQRDGVLWRRPDALLRKMAGVPLGVAADALDTAVATLAGKTDRITQLPYRAMPRIQSAVAENHARLAAARSYVFSALEAQWTKLERNEPLTATERADVWLSRTNAFQTARQVVGDLYDAIGGAAVYTNEGPFDRHLRDLQTACQHVVGQTRGWEDVGGLLLGNATTHPLL